MVQIGDHVVYADASTNLVQKSILYCYLKSKQRGSREESHMQYLEYIKVEGIPLQQNGYFGAGRKDKDLLMN
jgi:hypothetical protein